MSAQSSFSFIPVRSFWDELEYRPVLRNWIRDLVAKDFVTRLQLRDEMQRVIRDAGDTGARSRDSDRKKVERFLEDRSGPSGPFDPDFYTQMLIWVTNASSTADPELNRVKTAEPARQKLADAFLKWCRDNGIRLGKLSWRNKETREKMALYARTRHLLGDNAVEVLIQNMTLFLGIQNQQADIDKKIFGRENSRTEREAETRGYLVFRNTAQPDRVARMFIQFDSASAEWPFSMFRLFSWSGGDKPIETHGAIFGGASAIYLFGPFRGLEMNTIVISTDGLDGRWFTGLQVGPDLDGTIGASRLVFKRTHAEDDKEAGIGIVSRQAAIDELGHELARSLRNETEIHRPGLHGVVSDPAAGPVPLEPGALVEAIDARLQAPGILPPIRREGERPFNPADRSHLPFSTSLKLLRTPYEFAKPKRTSFRDLD